MSDHDEDVQPPEPNDNFINLTPGGSCLSTVLSARGTSRSPMEPLLIAEAERQLQRIASLPDPTSPEEAQLDAIALATAVICAHVALEARVNRILLDKVPGTRWADDPSIVNEPNEKTRKKLEQESIDKQNFIEKWKAVRRHFLQCTPPNDLYTLAIFETRASVLFDKEKMGITVLNTLRDTIVHYKGDRGDPFRDRDLVQRLVREARELVEHTGKEPWIRIPVVDAP